MTSYLFFVIITIRIEIIVVGGKCGTKSNIKN